MTLTWGEILDYLGEHNVITVVPKGGRRGRQKEGVGWRCDYRRGQSEAV